MPDRTPSNLPFEGEGSEEQRLWAALGKLPQVEPSADMRRSFYRNLEKASAPSLAERLGAWLGISNNKGWLTAAVSVLIGFGVSQVVSFSDAPAESERLAALEQNVAMLNREMILDSLQAGTPGERLMGVMDAGNMAGEDSEIAQALLVRATQDRSHSVRSAAIDALGPQLGSPQMGAEIMSLLEQSQSPIVQLSLVDLVLRHGTNGQLRELAKLASEDRLHPDLVRHVRNSLKGGSA
jgi:hypothetical protein